jgi:hypothetical protein
MFRLLSHENDNNYVYVKQRGEKLEEQHEVVRLLRRRRREEHRLKMELNLQSLFGLYVHSCTHWLRPRNFFSTQALGLLYEGAIGQPR